MGKLKETDIIYNGRQAGEVFGIHPAYKEWLKKKNLLQVEKTKEEWKKFFEDNKVI